MQIPSQNAVETWQEAHGEHSSPVRSFSPTRLPGEQYLACPVWSRWWHRLLDTCEEHKEHEGRVFSIQPVPPSSRTCICISLYPGSQTRLPVSGVNKDSNYGGPRKTKHLFQINWVRKNKQNFYCLKPNLQVFIFSHVNSIIVNGNFSFYV